MQNNNPFLASGITRLPYQQQYSTQVMACDNRTGRKRWQQQGRGGGGGKRLNTNSEANNRKMRQQINQ